MVAALILTLVLIVPELMMLFYRTSYFSPDKWHHFPPSGHHMPPFATSSPFPLRHYAHTVKDLVFFFCMSFSLLMYNTFRLHAGERSSAKKPNHRLLSSAVENILLCLLFFLFYTSTEYQPFRKPDGMLMLRCAVVAIVSYLFVYILLLIRHRQQMMLENEQLNTQNIQVRYEALAGQVNPHFLFNSLNTLSSLIREHQSENALKYINKLSDIFRYSLYANHRSVKTLREELEIIDAYRYLLEIRYGESFSMNLRIDEKYKQWLLPNLSLQPLLENAIKHNEVSAESPLSIDIYTTDEDCLVVSNRIRKKLDDCRNTCGIGLKNLNRRYQLLFSKEAVIENDGIRFTVKLPLINEDSGL
jgi:sensor histidine kinase YesM